MSSSEQSKEASESAAPIILKFHFDNETSDKAKNSAQAPDLRKYATADGNVVLKIEAKGWPNVIHLVGSAIEIEGSSSEGFRLEAEKIHLAADVLEVKTDYFCTPLSYQYYAATNVKERWDWGYKFDVRWNSSNISALSSVLESPMDTSKQEEASGANNSAASVAIDIDTGIRMFNGEVLKRAPTNRKTITVKGNVVVNIEATGGKPIVLQLATGAALRKGEMKPGITLEADKLHWEADELEITKEYTTVISRHHVTRFTRVFR